MNTSSDVTLGLAALLLLLAACGGMDAEHGRSRLLVSENGDTAHVVAADDAALVRARHDARCTVDEFVRRFHAPPPTQTELGLKALFREGEEAEHLWLAVFAIEGDSLFRGTVNNDVLMMSGLRYEDTVAVRRADVSDWYAVDRDTLIGGFSIRVFRTRRSAAERLQDDRAQGYVIGDELEHRRRLPNTCDH